MKIGIANDHTGVALKNEVMEHLIKNGFEVIDYGVGDGERCDYPIAGEKVASEIIAGNIQKGVLICGTGIGISLAANKVKGIRAAVVSESYSARMAALHNDAHIIAFGARVVGSEVAKNIVDTFFSTEFEGGRHQERVNIITEIENKWK